MGTFLIICTVVLVSVLIYLIMDYRGPNVIRLQPDNTFGIPGSRANDLIVHEFDRNENLWVSRGMIIYQLKKGDDKFIKMAHVPSGFSFYWLNNFRAIRRLTHKPECIEAIVTEEGRISVLSAGFMWYGDTNRKRFKKSVKLLHFGISVGRGIFNGLLKTKNNLLFFGEYFSNLERTHYVRIYISKDYGQTWQIAYEFKPGTIRHIHALQEDPYTGRLWICVGDESNEAMIGWSENEYNDIIPIGKGSLIWTACKLVFTEDAVYWGTDTVSEDLSGIYRWDKKSMELSRISKIYGAIFFGTRLTNGTIVMSTDIEGFPNEEDDRTRLYIIREGDKISIIPCGTWQNNKSSLKRNHAKLRIQRNQGNDLLILSCLNQKEIPDGDLLIYPEETLISV
jgi:hypothetical protein